MTTSPDTSATPSDRPTPSARGPVARVLVGAVTLYQRALGGRPTACRFYPSCSAYAVEALAAHGAARGSWLALRRLFKCHPFGSHGIDLVPPAGGPS